MLHWQSPGSKAPVRRMHSWPARASRHTRADSHNCHCQGGAAAVTSAASAATTGGAGAAADAQAAAAEADLAQHAGDVGEWLGVDGGASLVRSGLRMILRH